MKILAFADLHGSSKALKIIKRKTIKFKPDMIICAGDLTIFGNLMHELLAQLNKLKKQILIVHGNHESRSQLKQLCSKFKNIQYIHKKRIFVKDILFIGYGGGGFSYIDKEFENWIKQIQPKLKKYKKIIFVTHAPPYGTKIDVVLEGHCGSKSYRRFIFKNKERMKLVISGHIHETSGINEDMDSIRIVNPGAYGTIIET